MEPKSLHLGIEGYLAEPDTSPRSDQVKGLAQPDYKIEEEPNSRHLVASLPLELIDRWVSL